MKNYWFAYVLAALCYATFAIFGKFGSEIHSKKCNIETDRPNCYIFYGIAQNDIGKSSKLKVNYLIEGFPKRPHTVFVEILDHNNELDFLYSNEHAASHKAHLCTGTCQRKYTSTYNIPKTLKPGKYKLRVTFKFKYLLGTKDMVSNDIKFEVK